MCACKLLQGKTPEQGRDVCLNCPLPACTIENATMRPTAPQEKRQHVTRPANEDMVMNCQKCTFTGGKPPPGCITPEWFSPADIRYCQLQIILGLRHLNILREGYWPAKPNGMKTLRDPQADKFAAEIYRRLESCGRDGLLTEAYYMWGETEERLAKIAKTDEYEIRTRIKGVIHYISGRMKGKYRRGRFTADAL